MRVFLHRFDQHFTASIQNWPDWVYPILFGATTIGHPFFTISIGVLAAAFGGWQSNWRILYAGLVVLGTSLLGALLKVFLHRDRPATEYVLNMRLETYSFPSGHAVGSTVAYGFLAYLLFFVLPAPWNYAAVGFLILLILLVGVSRIYLGAHYPSDVVAGWIVGLLGLLFIIVFIQPRVLL